MIPFVPRVKSMSFWLTFGLPHDSDHRKLKDFFMHDAFDLTHPRDSTEGTLSGI